MGSTLWCGGPPLSLFVFIIVLSLEESVAERDVSYPTELLVLVELRVYVEEHRHVDVLTGEEPGGGARSEATSVRLLVIVVCCSNLGLHCLPLLLKAETLDLVEV